MRKRPPWVRERNRQRVITALAVVVVVITITGLLTAARYKTAHDTTAPNVQIKAATTHQIATTLKAVAATDNEAIPYGRSCGVEMWAKKTLTLPGDASLPTTPIQTSIERLRSLTPATEPAAPQRLPGVEDREWSVRAFLLGVKIESDSDYHLVLADPANPQLTLIGEIPATFCTTSKRTADFAVARRSVEQIVHHRITNRFSWLDRHGVQNAPIVIVTGYGFFDHLSAGHRQSGGAPTGIELHPVVSVQLAAP